ncbi:MAG: tRNA 5-methoxyuridine(34)/uridine 5-oxyacetic acid(34) synthase CmoB [Halobacteriovorax sp.]|nr:tRNA 5-methoxyuridine(34)/uridine 5-oxyacetic acid(34) synthase CmoB [Halobacteriovorax sp.]
MVGDQMTFFEELRQERKQWWSRKDGQRLRASLDSLPEIESSFHVEAGRVCVGNTSNKNHKDQWLESAKNLIPWKKGPFQLFDQHIDAEWRSDLKWDRLAPHLGNIEGAQVLDIGCNNGYFLFRLAELKVAMAHGIDPVLPFAAQFELIHRASGLKNIKFDLFGMEHVDKWSEKWDMIFHMGIIYHHRSPVHQLLAIREALKPGGVAFIETIGIPGEDSSALFPPDRYARMGNVWFVPTLSCLMNWAEKAKFINIQVIADTDLTQEEQRLTPWCPPPSQSLTDGLDPLDPSKTIEGHPAPRRFMIKIEKKGGK